MKSTMYNRDHTARATDVPKTIDREEIQIRQMKYVDIFAATKTSLATTDQDPMHQYLHVSPNTIIEQWLETIMYWIMWTSSIYTGCAWTIDNGSANIGYVEPYKPRPILDKVLEYLAVLIMIIQTAIQSKERTKRQNELRSNLRVHITESLGGRKNEVLYFRTVATLPMKQGHGYGSTLTRIVTSLGNAQGKDIWLVSSNTAMNTGFYTKHGFVTVSNFELGNENPSWKGSPIPIHIMVRRVPSNV
ncbi:hypothetical protein ABKN59_011710 [Abortiporus biennis]